MVSECDQGNPRNPLCFRNADAVAFCNLFGSLLGGYLYHVIGKFRRGGIQCRTWRIDDENAGAILGKPQVQP